MKNLYFSLVKKMWHNNKDNVHFIQIRSLTKYLPISLKEKTDNLVDIFLAEMNIYCIKL